MGSQDNEGFADQPQTTDARFSSRENKSYTTNTTRGGRRSSVSPLSLPAPSDLTTIASTPPLTFQHETFFRITFSYSFWPNLTLKRPPKTAPLGHPNRPKIVPRRVLRTLLFKNVDFHEISAGVVSGAFLGPQDGAKIDPRSPQEGLKTDQETCRF